MESLNELKRAIVADGRISTKDVKLLRDTFFNEEGVTKAKADFLFKLKDTINKDHLISEFNDFFVEAITSFLLEG
jgi:hypothetical protein